MNPPQRAEGPSRSPAQALTTTLTTTAAKPQDQDDRTATVQMLTAFAVKYLATGDAAYDWLIVRKCPLCGHAHRHILFEGDATVIERAPSCARHRAYIVTVTDVVPSAVERQHRGAA